MEFIIGIISQKGGVGKSTLARSLAKEFASNGFETLIADMDISQGTSTEWNSVRMSQELKPDISVQQFRTVSSALKLKKHYDVIIFDGAPHSTNQTLEIAKESDFCILPSSISKDDLNPQIRLAHELKKNKVPISKFSFALSKVGTSEPQFLEAKEYISYTPYHLFDSYISEKDGYRVALDTGKSLTETSYKTLNEKADKLIQEIFNKIKEIK